MQSDILDEILLPLADAFEAGNRNSTIITQKSPEEYEPLRERLAMLIAEGSLVTPFKSNDYKLTRAGYARYKPRIDALRALPR